jgi:hypothetical protein
MKPLLATALCGTLLLAACESTRRAAAPAQPSGFLSPDIIARLQPTETGVRSYINPAVDFRRYTRVLVEPVQLWVDPSTTRLSAEQRQLVANAFYTALRDELGRDVELVERPGPGTMVVTTAITTVRGGGNPVLSSVSTFVPATRLAREGAAALTGADPLTGGAAGEVRVTDAQTGDLLAAGIDARDATAGARVRTSRWDDVVVVSRYWARLMSHRLCRLQQRANCRTP